ncbi:hypothetical protein KUCAC02_005977 [Chaenocephalus aceratus]|uniref:Uncharacterized protein n=1 Tax=Chaenocephalus aceratus TaxID=36190 RepID=A0ACB9WR47_CHAAC|nr:hypothetical protein KUCAC02_005977 [Chaenocephalus aceratus]
MGHPRFTGCVRSLTSSGPLGPISCLDLACKENSRRSQADSEVEPSKHTGRTETGGKRNELVAVQEVELGASRMIYGSVSWVVVGPGPTVTQGQRGVLRGPIRGCPQL